VELTAVPPANFAEAALTALRRSLDGLARPCIALPTGATPIPVYQRLLATGFCFPAGTRLFALDEYAWPDPAHPGTNASFFRSYWRPDSSLPEIAIPRADAPDPHGEITRYCSTIADAGGLDVAVLGIGTNGHIAFNEPGSARDAGCRVMPLTEPTGRASLWDPWQDGPTQGLTVGVREIMAARRVLLLATGAGKRDIIRAALHGPVTAHIPASYLQEHPALTVVTDTEAWPL
jgi:glucosamine-6-phosphate deaminase